MSQPILEARSLAKLFGTTPVFSGVELMLGPGEGAVIIGRNGVGKSTLIKTLCGLSAPTSGQTLIFGQDSRHLDAVNRRVGVLAHQSMLYSNLTARENLEFYGQLYALPSPAASASQWLDRMDLAAAADKRVRTFSRGMEQRLAIARALLPEPELLLLDEPFAALDGDGVALVTGLVEESIARRRAVLITAHAPVDLGGLQFTMLELVRGRLIALGGEDGTSGCARCPPSRIVSGFAAILRKDLKLEMRTGDSTITLVALSVLILLALVLAFDPNQGRSGDLAAGALWIALIFAGMLGSSRVLIAERHNGCILGLLLSPIDRAQIYAAKLAAAFIFMMVAEMASIILLMLFFNLEFGIRLARLVPTVMLGGLGFSAISTLLATIASRTRAGDLLLPVLVVPMFVPALIAGVKASAAALAGATIAAMASWLKIMIAFDVLFVVAGYLLFDYVVVED